MTDTPWVIELSGPHLPQPLQLRLDARLVLGRGVAGELKQPDVDLTPYGAEMQGVSRLHAAIYTENERLMVADLESGNGTFLNDARLKPDEPHRLSHEDELTLGRFKLKVSVIVSPTYGGDVHKQPSLQLQDQTIPGNGELVLIVEDDPQVAKVLSIIMERAGYRTRISAEVVGAIRVFNQTRPSAVILDILLPGMNGLEFCRYVRRNILYNNVPIVAVSAAKTPPHISEAMQAGADIFLAKPVSAKELRHVVSSLIKQRENGSTAMHTKHLVGTAPLKAVKPESRRDSVVIYVAGYSDSPVVLNIQQPVSFGRAGSTGGLGVKNHVDLSRYDAINYGVSRMHMTLHNKDGKFFVEDMGTVNGTYINGEPSKSGELIPVGNADEIRLGRLRMYIYFLTDNDRLPE